MHLHARVDGVANANYPGFVAPPVGVTPDLNWEPNKWNIVIQALCIGLTTMFVATRFATKWWIMKEMHPDDYVCLLAWVGSVIYSSITLSQSFLGLGVSQWNMSPATASAFLKRGYLSQILYGPIAFCTKLAILLLLIRIFAVKERFVLFARVLIGVCAAYYISITSIQIFLCRPISKAYNPKVLGKCLDSRKIFIANTAIAIVTDVAILASPMPIIWRLKMSFWSRVGSSAVLAAGGLGVFH
ncbi:hypothetical protein P280DRAFT_515568 [Massarina eburnea CBS 473.64]|uniref:Rhodopsin domain-containing protein n=1 Tax=Massarina eburnea CBS 473.64 TaxID=1395130 RepID=A0A6A6S5X0_9PLEO|nr:hypothetical protein P280DRAFT_515568 [Massarina eburnea CBS 473.64]